MQLSPVTGTSKQESSLPSSVFLYLSATYLSTYLGIYQSSINLPSYMDLPNF